MKMHGICSFFSETADFDSICIEVSTPSFVDRI